MLSVAPRSTAAQVLRHSLPEDVHAASSWTQEDISTGLTDWLPTPVQPMTVTGTQRRPSLCASVSGEVRVQLGECAGDHLGQLPHCCKTTIDSAGGPAGTGMSSLDSRTLSHLNVDFQPDSKRVKTISLAC